MTRRLWGFIALLLGSGVIPSFAMAVEELPEHRQKAIWAAVPEEPRVQPAEPRTVLVFNTPDHLYDKDPHKGYCVPYGSYAMKALGEKSGAYQPVVSNDPAMFLPEKIKQFDAIQFACDDLKAPMAPR